MSQKTDEQALRIAELERELEILRDQHNVDLLAEQNAGNYPAPEETSEQTPREQAGQPDTESVQTGVVEQVPPVASDQVAPLDAGEVFP